MLAIAVSCATFLLASSVLAQPGSPAPAQAAPQKLSASAIQVERTDPPPDLVIPEDFRISTYENVLLQLEKTKKFQTVYRSGDQRAAGVKDLIILKLVPQAYTAGSQKQREVTTIKGATSITIKVQFTDRDGKVLLEKDIQGKVRFYGENLNATYDFAKKVAKVVNESF
jgi:hypothetical protein